MVVEGDYNGKEILSDFILINRLQYIMSVVWLGEIGGTQFHCPSSISQIVYRHGELILCEINCCVTNVHFATC